MTADNIKTIRATLELTRDEFAALIEVDGDTVDRWEDGTLSPTIEQRTALATVWRMAGADFELGDGEVL